MFIKQFAVLHAIEAMFSMSSRASAAILFESGTHEPTGVIGIRRKQMLYRLIIAIVALGLFPTSSQCETFTLEMTSATNINLNCSILPSIATFSFNGSSSDSSIVGFLPDLLKTRFSGNLSASGHVDLSFNLIVRSEILSQTGTYSFRSYSNTGPIGAPGATASLRLEGPIVFNSQIGTFTINYSTVYSNLLGEVQGSVDNDHLFVRMEYVRVPEPPSSMLSLLTPAILCYRRCRLARSAWLPVEKVSDRQNYFS